eukprot:gene8010-biopygen8085
MKRWLLSYDDKLPVSNIDPCLFYIFIPSVLIIFVYFHVDNFLVITSSEEWQQQFFADFNQTYPCVDEGTLTEILGIRMVFRDTGLLRECRMHQEGFIHRMLDRYGMAECNPSPTPMEPKLVLTPADPQEPTSGRPYANLAMELMWLARCTRPDIMTAVCYLARFMHCHTEEHWQHLLRVLRYLKGSLVRLNGSTVMYSSRLQKTVALSTADAELVALSETAQDIEHLIHLISEFAPVQLPVVLHGNNHASVLQAEGALNNTATRHITVRDRYVAKLVELGRVIIAKVPSAQNLANFFTKSLAANRFHLLRSIVLRYFQGTVG